MNAAAITPNDLTFGIEIELVGISKAVAAKAVAGVVGGVAQVEWAPYYVQMADGRRWNFVHDGSLVDGTGRGTCEVVSPILTAQDLPMVVRILEALRAAGGLANDTCGIHVHVGTQRLSAAQIVNVFNYVNRREDLFVAALGVLPSRRKDYARPVSPERLRRITEAKPTTLRALNEAWYGMYRATTTKYDDSRYHGLNLHSVFYQDRGTLEFRYFNGTTDGTCTL
jgi:hypothetical protein